MLKVLQHTRLPNGSRAVVAQLRAQYENSLRFTQVIQINKFEDRHGWLRLFSHLLPVAHDNSEGFLLFRRVSSHADDWSKVRRGNRWVAPAFVHVVLHGSAKVTVGRASKRVVAGDIFVMDMHKKHSVDSDSLCITAVSTVPRLLYA